MQHVAPAQHPRPGPGERGAGIVARPQQVAFDPFTFVGSATGARYSVALNGVIQTTGAGASYLPGNSAGSSATGGQYA